MKNNMVKRIGIYLLGCLFIAIGINISKLAKLGISPSSSVPRALEVSFGFTLGTCIVILYFILVLAQLLLLKKDFKLIYFFEILVGVVFGWLVDFVGIDPKAFGHLMYGFPAPETYIMKLVYLAISIVIIGIGVFIYLKAELIPMPPEGLAAAISKRTGKPFGDCKTLVDTGLMTTALIIQLITLGGLKSFTGDVIVVREGTIISALLVGQVVKALRNFETKVKAKKAA